MAKYVNRAFCVRSVAFDDGNHTKKILTEHNNRVSYKHLESAVAPVHASESRYMKNGVTKDGYIMVDGQMYAVGSTARRQRRSMPKGAERYTRDYYRVGLAYMLAQLFGGENVDVDLHATHAPQDYAYAPEMADAISGLINCVTPHGKTKYSVHTMTTIDEPLAGAYATFYNDRGKIYHYWTVGNHIILVVDIGGFTTDLAIIESGIVDVDTMRSMEMGADNVYKMFIKGVRDDSTLKRKLGKLTESNYVPEMVRDAIQTGYWANDSDKPIDVQGLSSEVLNFLVSEIEDGINSMGGLINYTDVIFTGGGCGLAYSEFVSRHNGGHTAFHIAETNNSLLRFANVFGVRADGINNSIWGNYDVS